MAGKKVSSCPDCGSGLFRVFYLESLDSDSVRYQQWGRCIECLHVWVEGELRCGSPHSRGDAG